MKHTAGRSSLWLVVAFALLGVATSGSTFRVSMETYRYLFVIDITQSMNVSDMAIHDGATTRLTLAKSVIEAALQQLPCGSEAGLAIFAAHRTFVMFTPVEICQHYRALSDMLAKVNWRMAWAARSEVAKGLYSAIEAARRSQGETRLVFLTDGHEAPPVNPDIRPRFVPESPPIHGFISGIGGLVPSRIPHLDDDDQVAGYWRHDEVMQVDIHSLGRPATEQAESMVGTNMVNLARRIALGQEHLSSLREAYLRELAAETGLDYVRIQSAARFVANVHKDSYARRTPVLSDLGWVPASLAFVILTYSFFGQYRTSSARASADQSGQAASSG